MFLKLSFKTDMGKNNKYYRQTDLQWPYAHLCRKSWHLRLFGRLGHTFYRLYANGEKLALLYYTENLS